MKPEEVAGHVGDLVSLETTLSFKKFFDKIGSKNLNLEKKVLYKPH